MDDQMTDRSAEQMAEGGPVTGDDQVGFGSQRSAKNRCVLRR
jgi:hypothetical protein